jgi:hypothetical protein
MDNKFIKEMISYEGEEYIRMPYQRADSWWKVCMEVLIEGSPGAVCLNVNRVGQTGMSPLSG